MKVSQLCKMIEDSIHNGKYPLEDQQKYFANSLQVINRSDSDYDLKKGSGEIKVEVRIQGLYVTSNYASNIEHLPGVIEVDVLDSFKMLCRRLGRIMIQEKPDNGNNPKGTTISTIEKLHQPNQFSNKENSNI
jgi:hypothetical protein